MKKIRVLIVDDEPLARERLRALLQAEPDIELAGECATGREAVAAIEAGAPELVFLDVQMPELDGFGVLQEIPAGRLPAVIFVTAHDKFALKAFEVHAVDYLLKPFDRERFQTALQRARALVNRRRADHAGGGEPDERFAALLAELKPRGPAGGERLGVKSGGRLLLLKLDELDWIEAADNYVNLHVGAQTHVHRQTLSAFESQLPAGKFLRISRSVIVNIDRIRELQPLFHGEHAVILRDNTRLILSRGYRHKIRELTGGAE